MLRCAATGERAPYSPRFSSSGTNRDDFRLPATPGRPRAPRQQSAQPSVLAGMPIAGIALPTLRGLRPVEFPTDRALAPMSFGRIAVGAKRRSRRDLQVDGRASAGNGGGPTALVGADR